MEDAFNKSWADGILYLLINFNPVKLISDAINGLIKYLFDIDLYAAGAEIIGRLCRGMLDKFEWLNDILPNWVCEMPAIDSVSSSVGSAFSALVE